MAYLYTLDEIQPGQRAVVKKLMIHGAMRRRLLDIGLSEGTEVECVGRSPMGDPSAYLIRGAVTAIRRADCRGIAVVPEGEADGGSVGYDDNEAADFKKSPAGDIPAEKTEAALHGAADIPHEKAKNARHGAAKDPAEKNTAVVALAGNPNVGKSTIFNSLTGLHQHTGNWPGKTVSSAKGRFSTSENDYVLADIPGTYSLMAHSAEEEVARNFICFGGASATVVVCDATCLERSLNLALQVMEICPETIVCVNLMDEARRRGIEVDLERLEENLGVPVVGTSARRKKTLRRLTERLDDLCAGRTELRPRRLHYIRPIEDAIAALEPAIRRELGDRISPRWLALRLLEGDSSLNGELDRFFGAADIALLPEIARCREQGLNILAASGITADILKDRIVSCILLNAEEACDGAVCEGNCCRSSDRRADRLLTSRLFGYPLMLLLLMVVFWITIVGANYPSELLSTALFALGDLLSDLLRQLSAPEWLRGLLIDGAYRVLAWVTSVMLPPMAIFFPLFTLLEDSGYLPRIAYNLDRPFSKCKACGKQALTMCMGFGCNAAGITGCRIIDSRRERLIAMLTNNFVPCNGRFPMIITIISLFFVTSSGLGGSILSAAALTGVIVLGVAMTLVMSRLLSATLLRGEPSSFTLELPPYRAPQFGKVIVRSLLDRTIFVLGRAASVAAPAGLVIWLLANITVGGAPLLTHITQFLDPFGRFIGMDGVIVAAFILGLPANEIVVPLIIMAYMQQGSLAELAPAQMAELFAANGWNGVTALCVIIFSLMHWPCSTSLLTLKKEAGGLKWAALGFVLPTMAGIILCALVANVARLIGIC